MSDCGPSTQAAFERALKALVDRSMQAVTYHEIAYEDGAPMWNRESRSFDSLDFGLELRLDDGSVFSFTWGAEFTQYNVSIRQGPLSFGDTARQWDASKRWGLLLGARIVDVTSRWLPTSIDHRMPAGAQGQGVARLAFRQPLLPGTVASGGNSVLQGPIPDHERRGADPGRND